MAHPILLPLLFALTVLAAWELFCYASRVSPLLSAIGLALFGLVALGEMAVRRWYGGEMPVGGVI